MSALFFRENEIIKTKRPLHTAVERAKEITKNKMEKGK
jgi:hypothetical protein